MMTLLNLISIVIFVAVTLAVVLIVRRLRKVVDAANGVGPVNELGEDGTSEDGIQLGEVGASKENPSQRCH